MSEKSEPLLWAEIDLGAIARNVREIRRVTQERARVMVAVKANGYGHGAVKVSETALLNGATDLGVARIQEGLELRQAGITAPILIFGYVSAESVQQLLDHRLIPTVSSLEHAVELAGAADAIGQSLPIHVKVDTGMGRLGLPGCGLNLEDSVAQAFLRITQLKGVEVKGLYTHFATADHRDKQYAQRQFECFNALCARLRQAGFELPLLHAANSGAIIDMPETHLDMVRVGISVYGLYPSDEVDRSKIDLKPAMALKARIIHLKQVPAGTCISYGCTYKTNAPTTIATVPVGYADGYNRRLSNRGAMLVGGHKVPVVGPVCMDLTMVDVGSVPEVNVGDEVVLIGRQGQGAITADEVAGLLDTINYEVVSALTERVPKVFINRT